jgi:hypothetical protein
MAETQIERTHIVDVVCGGEGSGGAAVLVDFGLVNVFVAGGGGGGGGQPSWSISAWSTSLWPAEAAPAAARTYRTRQTAGHPADRCWRRRRKSRPAAPKQK